MRIFLLAALLFLFTSEANAQLPDSCKLRFGTNLAGLADWGTEIPFVDLMRMSRTWYTKSIGDPEDPFDSGFTGELDLREDGYPSHVPQTVPGSPYPQKVVTIWAITDGWPAGEYTVLWEGEGELTFWGNYENLRQTSDHRIVFDFPEPKGSILEMTIERSEIENPIRDIRLLMPGTEDTYESEPFYDLWLEKLEPFHTVRFMDWGQTNNWGQINEWEIGDGSLVNWDERSQPDYYTWTHNKGVPYEMMIELMNRQKIDGWVCVPHTASEDYIRRMARYFRDQLDPDLHLYVEYSNEIWNWMFGQAQWTNTYGPEASGETWPEGTVKFIQRTMDYWTEEFEGQPDRITRVVGVQTGWQDVAERVVYNMRPNSFDAVSPTYYFSFDEAADEKLDALGEVAGPEDIARHVRENMERNIEAVRGIRTIADSLNKQLAFYEGGQHFTPHPFGEEPTYAQALLDIQRDPVMYDLYQEWFGELREIHRDDSPWLLMNFSFISDRSARYGSWGILETMDQDTKVIPAPKYQAIMDNIYGDCEVLTSSEPQLRADEIVIYPNPARGTVKVKGLTSGHRLYLYDAIGRPCRDGLSSTAGEAMLDLSSFPPGLYYLQIRSAETGMTEVKKIIKL